MAEEQDTPTPKTKAKAQEPQTIKLVSTHDLLEPINMIRFPAGIPVEVTTVTGWMQSQIDVGLITVA